MQTGEGKTLAALLAVSALLLSGSVQVLTANDYLAVRDAAWMGATYEMLGARVAGIGQNSTPVERRSAYSCNVLYATPNEIGFDLLRDQLALSPSDLVQADGHISLLVDEADSILIDEARIPLVIAGGRQEPSRYVRAMARLAPYLEFTIEDGRNARLTARGIAQVEAALRIDNLYAEEHLPALIAAQEAVHAQAFLHRDVDYVVKDGRVEQVDQFKGRIAADRRWPADLQWAVEAKEGVTLQPQGRILGSITLADLMRLYPHRCGMTGTAATHSVDFWREYGLRVAVIPTHKPCIREDRPDRIFATQAEKDAAVVQEIKQRQPVLVGTAACASPSG
jgi:preprotein translocase subunit SecA